MYFARIKTGKISRLQKYEKICNNPILSSTRPIMTPRYHLSSMDSPRTTSAQEMKIRGLSVLSCNSTIQGNNSSPKVWLIKSEFTVYSEITRVSFVKCPSTRFATPRKPETSMVSVRNNRNCSRSGKPVNT